VADSEEVRVVRRALGRQLAGYRVAAGLSQTLLASRIHYSRSTIANAEVGRQNAPRAFWQRADELLAADGRLLDAHDRLQVLAWRQRRDAARVVSTAAAGPTAEPGLRQSCEDRDSAMSAPGRPYPSEAEEMNRRELLRLFSMAGAQLALPEAGLDDARITCTGGAERVDAPGPAEYAALNTHLWQVFGLTTVKSHLLPLVRNQLGVLTDGLRRSAGPARQQLCLLTADVFQLAGEVFFDGNQYADAAHCYTLAGAAGKEADAFDLWACSLTRHAYLAVYERRFHQAAPMLELAAALARRGDPALSTRYWIAAVNAETLAGLGDRDGCERALDAAAAVQGMTGTVHNGGWLRFDGSRLAEERGLLRHPRPARPGRGGTRRCAGRPAEHPPPSRRAGRPGDDRRLSSRPGSGPCPRRGRAGHRPPHRLRCDRPQAAESATPPRPVAGRHPDPAARRRDQRLGRLPHHRMTNGSTA
jgi:transcriptional regulator with XRE-family HTH domain